MSVYYILIFCATFMFAFQFLFNSKYERCCGNSFSASITFMIYTSGLGIVLLLVVNGFWVEWSGFSLIMALVNTMNTILLTYTSLKALSVVNLSMFSLFLMLGGMLLPFL